MDLTVMVFYQLQWTYPPRCSLIPTKDMFLSVSIVGLSEAFFFYISDILFLESKSKKIDHSQIYPPSLMQKPREDFPFMVLGIKPKGLIWGSICLKENWKHEEEKKKKWPEPSSKQHDLRINRPFFVSCFTNRYLFSPSFFVFFLINIMALTSNVPTFKEEVSPGRVLTMAADGTGLSVVDPWLEPFNDALRER